MTTSNYKAIAVPSRILLHPTENTLRTGGDELRVAADSSATMRRNATQGQTWRNIADLALVRDQSELRVDTYIAATEGFSSSLAMREDGVMLLSDVDDATAGFLCHLAKKLGTTFMLAPVPTDAAAGAALLREERAALIGKMKKGPFLDAYYWTSVAHVNEGPDVVKRYKIKTGEIAPDADKKADAKEKKKAATKEKSAEAAAE